MNRKPIAEMYYNTEMDLTNLEQWTYELTTFSEQK
jgi:hypothetical protein